MVRCTAFWYRNSWLSWWLLPFSWLFQVIAQIRKQWYLHIKKRATFPVPIIIVGNISVGGTGKTPCVAQLVVLLQQHGWRPGIVMRGYKGAMQQPVCMVTTTTSSTMVGDEAVLLFHKTRVPLVVGKNRVAAAKTLLAQSDVNVIISDDGLQHYALRRNIEIVVIDATRQLGNGFCLPAGPLREPPSRLRSVDFVITHGVSTEKYSMVSTLSDTVYALNDETNQQPLSAWTGKTVHAVAGIGNPDRFFAMLRAKGIHVIVHPFSDHHDFVETEFAFSGQHPIVMTEKDAVKCKNFTIHNAWVVPLSVTLSTFFCEDVLQRLRT